MLLQRNNDLSEIGLNSVSDKMCRSTALQKIAVQNNFHLKPYPLFGQVTSVDLSCTHAAAVLADNETVTTWGHGKSGVLGILSPHSTTMPTVVTSIDCQIKQIVCGAEFTLMMTQQGKVLSYGKGTFGKLGHGDEEDRKSPTLINTLQNVQAIAAGGDHAAAVTNKGYLYQWGLECADPQLTQFDASPKLKMGNVTVTSISCGTHHSVLLGDGTFLYSGIAYAWGRGSHGRLGVGHRQNLFYPGCVRALYDKGIIVTQVSTGDKHTAFLTKNGEVYTCGSNVCGQLGYFTSSEDSDVPCKVCLGKNAAGNEIRAEKVCCNEDYTMVLTQDGSVIVWGKCFYGTKLEDSIPLDLNDKKDINILDVTTCNLLSEDVFVELTYALTSDCTLLICAGMLFDMDCLVTDGTTPVIPVNKTNLKTLCSVGHILVSVDAEGKVFYADLSSWLYQVEPEKQKTPRENFMNTLLIKMKERASSSTLPTIEFVPIPSFHGSVIEVQATLGAFFFCSSIGDVYSWSPGDDVLHHKELNNEIILQIACGANHCVAISTEGTVYACGDGSSGQLGNGSFRSADTFQLVPLTEFERVKNVSCGWASTCVITENGKVYFWGQLDLPRGEKIRRKQKPFKFAPRSEDGKEDGHVVPAGYELKVAGDVGVCDPGFVLVGQALTLEIFPRNTNFSSASCMEFRTEVAVASPNSSQILCKGTIKRSQTSNKSFVASVVFHSEGTFNVHVTRNGQNVLGSPFKVTSENGVELKKFKLSLIGCDIDCIRTVGGVLQQAISDRKELGIELWGVPSITADLQTQETFQLASVTDGGIYIYVWDAISGKCPEENLSFWLHQLFLSAPRSNVILLGVNSSASYANDIDLKPFQKTNPQLKRCIFAGITFTSEPRQLLEEVLSLAHETTKSQRLVRKGFQRLVAKVAEEKKSGAEILNESSFKCLAGECGLENDSLCKEAAENIEIIGMCLLVRAESFSLVLQPSWLSRHLNEMTKVCHLGSVDRSDLETPKQHLMNLLISKRLALERKEKSKIDIVPLLSSIPEESWSPVDESRYTLYRHLILRAPSYDLHSIFHCVAANALQNFTRVSLGRYYLVIHNDHFQCRIDCGPCIVNASVAEIRIIVRANSREKCKSVTQEMESFLETCYGTLGLSSEVNFKASCSICRQCYIDLADIQEVSMRGDEDHVSCKRCHRNIPVGDLLNGFNEMRDVLEMNWRPFHGLQVTDGPSSKYGTPSPEILLRPLMLYLGDRDERQETKLLSEIRGMFENMTRMFADMKNYDTPRTVCILPEFQRSSVLKGNALKSMLTYGQPRYRLFLLCEGHGDGTGVHLLDYDKHKGYKLEKVIADRLIKESVSLLRKGVQLLSATASLIGMGAALGPISEVLGIVGLSVGLMTGVPWKKVFNEMDNFLKGVQESAGSVHQPKGLSDLSADVGIGYQVDGEKYAYMRKLLSELGPTDDFGGLLQEPRNEIGAVWVCEKHRLYAKETNQVKVMP